MKGRKKKKKRKEKRHGLSINSSLHLAVVLWETYHKGFLNSKVYSLRLTIWRALLATKNFTFQEDNDFYQQDNYKITWQQCNKNDLWQSMQLVSQQIKIQITVLKMRKMCVCVCVFFFFCNIFFHTIKYNYFFFLQFIPFDNKNFCGDCLQSKG